MTDLSTLIETLQHMSIPSLITSAGQLAYLPIGNKMLCSKHILGLQCKVKVNTRIVGHNNNLVVAAGEQESRHATDPARPQEQIITYICASLSLHKLPHTFTYSTYCYL